MPSTIMGLKSSCQVQKTTNISDYGESLYDAGWENLDIAKMSKKYIHISWGEGYLVYLRPQGPDGARVLGTKDHLEYYNTETPLGVHKRGPSSSPTHHSHPVSLGSATSMRMGAGKMGDMKRLNAMKRSCHGCKSVTSSPKDPLK